MRLPTAVRNLKIWFQIIFLIGYGGDSGGGINPLAAFIAPLAGLALLGAAAAVSIK